MATKIQFRRGLAVEWAATNPILSDGELGLEKDTKLYKIGDGVTPWNTLTYSTLQSVTTLMTMQQQNEPTTPLDGLMHFYAKSLSGRMLPRIKGPSGLSTPLQPSFFQNSIMMINTGASTTLTTFGCTTTNTGNITHFLSELSGYIAQFGTVATPGQTAGTGFSATTSLRGTQEGSNGFFFNARLGYFDPSYDQSGATTGSRIFVGFTSGTLAATVASDDVASLHLAGFTRYHSDNGRQDVNWQFMTKDGGIRVLQDTGCPFISGKMYDYYIFCKPQGDILYWRIDNISDGTSYEGSQFSRLPAASNALRPGFQIQTINALARNVRMQRVYLESDR